MKSRRWALGCGKAQVEGAVLAARRRLKALGGGKAQVVVEGAWIRRKVLARGIKKWL